MPSKPQSSYGVLRKFGVGVLRLPSRLVPIPGWFPLVVEPLHRRYGPRGGPLTVETNGVRMSLDVREYVQRRIFYGAFEVGEIRFVRSFVRPGDVVVDVGANVGLFTLIAAAAVGSTGQVHAFEPVPGNFARLQENLGLNQLHNVVAQRMALGEEAGDLTLGVDHAEGAPSGVSGHFTEGGSRDAVQVPVCRLDDYLAEHLRNRHLRLVKIDVEGMEPLVLRGLDRQLNDHWPDAFLIEVNPGVLAARGRSAAELIALVRDRGYELKVVGAGGGLHDADRRISKALRTPPADGWRSRVGVLVNLVALHPSFDGARFSQSSRWRR